MLQKIAASDPEPAVRVRAAGRLTDPKILTEIAQRNENFDVRLMANIKRHGKYELRDKDITELINATEDQWVLEDIAKHSERAALRLAALYRLTDEGFQQPILCDIALHAKEMWLRFDALEIIADETFRQRVLKEIAIALCD